MPPKPVSLPRDPDLLQAMVLDLSGRLAKTEGLLRQLLAARTGRKSEQISREQLALFAQEAGIELAEETQENRQDQAPAAPDPPTAGGTSRAPHGRRPFPGHLKRETIVHDLEEAEKHCDGCGRDLRQIGEETSERYEYIPAQVKIVEDVCKKYACECTVRTAAKPWQPIEKSTAGASLLAQVVVGKLADHLPLHRQVKMFRRHGVDLAEQTLGGWMAQTAELLRPLYGSLKKFVLESHVVGTDDTPVKVLDRKLRHARKGRIWPYVGDRDHRAAVYDYTPTRERAGPEEFLKEYRGKVQADAYPGYDAFFKDPKRGLEEVGCMAHARRHFFDARDSDTARMGAVLAYIGQLYAVEKDGRERGLKSEDLLLLRQVCAKPVLTEMHGYLQRIQGELLPKSQAGQAVNYALKNWTALTRYANDGRLSIDNNHTERSIRCFAVGRNNWMFFGSDRGGKTAAILRSFVTSCELVKIDPFAWFHDVLSRIANHPVNRLDELLPHRWSPVRA